MSNVDTLIQLKTKVYYVYHCFVDGELKYIGMGKGDRYKHCNSGKSSCAELNRDLLQGKNIQVKIFEDKLNKNDAIWTELKQINDNQDKGLYNKNSKTSPFTLYPSCDRILDLKMKENQRESDVVSHLCKISPNLETSRYEKLKNALHAIDLDFYIGKIGNTQIMVIDKYDTRKTDKHIGCHNWPNCDEVGCGR